MSYGITQSYLPPDRGSVSRPYPGRIGRYSIYPPIKDERLSRPCYCDEHRLPQSFLCQNDIKPIWLLQATTANSCITVFKTVQILGEIVSQINRNCSQLWGFPLAGDLLADSAGEWGLPQQSLRPAWNPKA